MRTSHKTQTVVIQNFKLQPGSLAAWRFCISSPLV